MDPNNQNGIGTQMDKTVTGRTLPLGAKTFTRRRVAGKSFELAEQLAWRGASENLIRAVGGDEAVAKLACPRKNPSY